MKRLTYILMLTVLLASCSQKFEMSLPLAVNRDEIKLPAGSGSTYLMIYSTGSWTIEGESSWLTLSRLSGSGNTQVNLSYDANEGLSRESTFTVTGNGKTIGIKISQEGSKNGESLAFGFEKNSIMVTKGESVQGISLLTDLPADKLEGLTASVLYADEDSDPWISGLSFNDGILTFSVLENLTGMDRIASVSASAPVAYWDTPPTTTLWITQTAGSLTLGDVPERLEVNPDGATPVSLTLEPPYSSTDFDYTINFAFDGETPDWLTDVAFDGLVFSAMPKINYGAAREARIVFTLVYEGKEEDRRSVILSQAHTEQSSSGGGIDGPVEKDNEKTF